MIKVEVFDSIKQEFNQFGFLTVQEALAFVDSVNLEKGDNLFASVCAE